MYISDLEIEFYRKENGIKQYLLSKPLILIDDNDDKIIVPVNFKTDLASIPRPLNHWIKPNHHKYIKSVIIHDYLYTEFRRYTRSYADKMLLKCMKYEKCPRRYYIAFYLAVRMFGWLHYKK